MAQNPPAQSGSATTRQYPVRKLSTAREIHVPPTNTSPTAASDWYPACGEATQTIAEVPARDRLAATESAPRRAPRTRPPTRRDLRGAGQSPSARTNR
jgi:hypothetical protein